MKPLFLTSPELLNEYWEQAAIHFEPVVTEAARGEFTVLDIRTLAEEKRATIAIVLDGENVILAIAFEFIHYPRITACNIIALGGSRLNEAEELFFITFKQWLYGMGVTVIEASCSSVMSRLLRRYGFAKTYEVVRLSL
jgi:hypothetical protein